LTGGPGTEGKALGKKGLLAEEAKNKDKGTTGQESIKAVNKPPATGEVSEREL